MIDLSLDTVASLLAAADLFLIDWVVHQVHIFIAWIVNHVDIFIHWIFHQVDILINVSTIMRPPETFIVNVFSAISIQL